jgi:hypothetical protein
MRFTLILLVIPVIACGNEPPGGACVVDRDCPGSEVCDNRACVAPARALPDAAAGCGKDTDCKGDRICVAATCVAPPAASADAGAAGEAVLKFCHELLVDNERLTLTVTGGGKTFAAFTRQCSPCQSLPAGVVLDFVMTHPSGAHLLDFQKTLEPGSHVFFGTMINNEASLKFAHGPAGSCPSFDPFGANRP